MNKRKKAMKLPPVRFELAVIPHPRTGEMAAVVLISPKDGKWDAGATASFLHEFAPHFGEFMGGTMGRVQ